MDHSDLLVDTAKIIDIVHRDDQRSSIILDQTIFYPQGGGQPYDHGTITGKSGSLNIEEVRFSEGIVYHIGTIIGILDRGSMVTLKVDSKRRECNSRNHTGGHIIDIAMRKCKQSQIPTRGYHFPEGAYVEYEGTLDEEERENLRDTLQKEVDLLVKEARPVTIRLVSIDELKKIANYVPAYLPKDKPSRAMVIDGYPAIPCGGTHAKSTNIGTLTIVKIKNKSGNLRISYEVS